MAVDKKISQFPTVTSAGASDYIPLVQGGQNKKITKANLSAGLVGIDGAGTVGTIPVFTSTEEIGDSFLSQDASSVIVATGKNLIAPYRLAAGHSGAPGAIAHFKGTTSDSTEVAILVENSSGDDLLLLRNDRYAQFNLDRIDVKGVAGNASLYMMSPTGTVDPTISFYHNGGTLSGYIGATNTNLNLDAVDNIFLKSSGTTVTTLKSTGFEFVSGKGIDTALTGGSDVLNIGATNADVINYGNASTVHNFLGTAIYELQVNAYVEDKLMTLNYGGASGSAIGVGFEIEENSLITGYIKTNAARTGFSILAPATSFTADLNFDLLDVNQSFQFPNNTGILALTSDIPAFGTTAGTVLEGNDARLGSQAVISGTDIDWNVATHFYKTLSANTTFSFSNLADAKTIQVAITNTASNYTVTWPTVDWGSSGAPIQRTGAVTDIYTFSRINGTVYGAVRQ